MTKVKIYVTEEQAEYCQNYLGFDPHETDGYEIVPKLTVLESGSEA